MSTREELMDENRKLKLLLGEQLNMVFWLRDMLFRFQFVAMTVGSAPFGSLVAEVETLRAGDDIS